TVDEEVTSAGAKLANEHPLAASCEYLINGEPTDNKLAIGTKGSLQATISTTGRAAHSAYPEAGESAIEKMLDVLADIRGVDWPNDPVFGETTCNIGIIAGGKRANIIPDAAEATIFLRLAVDSSSAQSALEDTIAERATIDRKGGHDPIRLFTVEGFEQMLARFTTDIPYLSNWGRPLLIGPGSILVAHTDHERINKRELIEAVDLYVKLVKSL
ncbi:MAG TPA: peptidase dimerization domain-containing protein, partial [Chthoniobacterales bacterium]